MPSAPPCPCGATYRYGTKPDPVLLATWKAAHASHEDHEMTEEGR
jgi:hypothetical protein